MCGKNLVMEDEKKLSMYAAHADFHVLMHINQCLICTLARGLGKNIVKTALSHVDVRPFFGTQPCVAEVLTIGP